MIDDFYALHGNLILSFDRLDVQRSISSVWVWCSDHAIFQALSHRPLWDVGASALAIMFADSFVKEDSYENRIRAILSYYVHANPVSCYGLLYEEEKCINFISCHKWSPSPPIPLISS